MIFDVLIDAANSYKSILFHTLRWRLTEPQALEMWVLYVIGYSGDKQQNRFRSALFDKLSQFISCNLSTFQVPVNRALAKSYIFLELI